MKRRIIALLALLLLAAPTMALAIAIHPTNKYAWGENIGWLNWGTPEGSVDVGDQQMSGYVWGENIGWISLNCSNTGSCATVNYHVNNTVGVISGYAWGENVGWISFNCSNTASCGTVNYGVTINQTTGDFSGYAWGENIGWISFNCSNTSSCGTVDYKVSLLFPPGGGGTGGGGGIPGGTPIPTATPSASPSPTATVSPSPTVTPTGTPIPSTPTPTPAPTPTTTPVATPPPATPTAPPPSYTPPPPAGPIVQIIDRIGQFLDFLGRVFGNLPPPVTSGAVAATVLAVIPLLTAFITILVQKEIAASSFLTLQAVGLKRKTAVWGTVYDSRTKHPIPLAKLQLFDANGRLVETRYADRDGRYGFLTNPASIHQDVMRLRIVASKDGYVFPSQQAVPGTDFLVYDNLYRGEVIEIRADSVVNFNVPMDPATLTKRIWSAWGLGLIGTLTDKLLNLGFILGLFLVPLNYIWHPTTTNLIIGIIFFGANSVRIFGFYRPYGVVTDATTGHKLPFALITLNDMSGKRLAFAVSDEHGRYFLPAERNAEYQLTAYSPAGMGAPRSVTTHITAHSRTSRRAWVTLNMKI